jgi:hypothetical protein
MPTQYLFGLEDVKVAPWNSAENWGTPQDLIGASMMQIETQTVNGQLEGDDKLLDVNAKVISAQVTMQYAFGDLAVLAVLTGQAVTDSTSVDRIRIIADDLPYFAACGKMTDTQTSGCTMLFVPKMKVMEAFRVGGQYGQYSTPELTAMAVEDSDNYGVWELYQYTTDQSVAFPPPPPA